MDSYASIGTLISVVQAVGPIGLLVYIYWSDQRNIKRIQDEANDRFSSMKQMYESNVVLVKNYEKITTSLVDLISLNTQHMTRVEDKIDTNQFCPFNRTKKTVSVKEDVS